MADDSVELIAWTDGGCRGNPGVGAWAYLLCDPGRGTAIEASSGERETTNNRMEFGAAIACLSALRRPSRIVIRTDSRLLIDSASKWMAGWKARGWRKKDGPLKNVDLLQALDAQLARHQVRWQWVEGHSGEAGNEHVDQLLNQTMDRIQAGAPAEHQRRFAWNGQGQPPL